MCHISFIYLLLELARIEVSIIRIIVIIYHHYFCTAWTLKPLSRCLSIVNRFSKMFHSFLHWHYFQTWKCTVIVISIGYCNNRSRHIASALNFTKTISSVNIMCCIVVWNKIRIKIKVIAVVKTKAPPKISVFMWNVYLYVQY